MTERLHFHFYSLMASVLGSCSGHSQDKMIGMKCSKKCSGAQDKTLELTLGDLQDTYS